MGIYLTCQEDAKNYLVENDYQKWIELEEWAGPGVYFLDTISVPTDNGYREIDTFYFSNRIIESLESSLYEAKNEQFRVLYKFFNQEAKLSKFGG